nr:hypothetical protein [Tanacetum cinerariifolium]
MPFFVRYTNETTSKDALINEIFPSFGTNTHLSVDIFSRAILSTENEHIDSINDMLIDIFPGEENVYYSFDKVEDDTHNYYHLEFLNSLNVSGFPPHHLFLKIGCPIIILRNPDPVNGLCNGTRLICKRFDPNIINAKIVVEKHAGVGILLPRIPLAPSEEDMFLFKLKRTQFPIRLSFAMTINKAQGKTILNVGFYFPGSVFPHGQLYVMLYRGILRTTTKAKCKYDVVGVVNYAIVVTRLVILGNLAANLRPLPTVSAVVVGKTVAAVKLLLFPQYYFRSGIESVVVRNHCCMIFVCSFVFHSFEDSILSFVLSDKHTIVDLSTIAIAKGYSFGIVVELLQWDTMSSPNHLTSNIEDAFFEYVLVVPDYSPASPGKTYPVLQITQLIMPPKRSSTSEPSTMSQAAIIKLVADSITAALETQTATMAEADNSIRNIRPR